MKEAEDAIVISSSSAVTKLDQHQSAEEMRAFCQYLIDGKLVPSSMKTPEAMMTVVIMGKELGMDAMTAINNIVPIQGKPTLGIHAIGALLRKSGAASQTLEDFVPIMGEVGTDKEGKVVDYRTSIKFLRPYHGQLLEEIATFTWKDATKMGLTDKDNWKRMPKVMLWSRCYAIGARRVAPDAMLGMYETSEWAEVQNIKHSVNEEGEAILL